MPRLMAVLIAITAALTFGRSTTAVTTSGATSSEAIDSSVSATASARRLSIRPCTSAALSVGFDAGDGFAGGYGYILTLTNVSKHACTVDGTPTLKFYLSNGAQIGPALGGESSPDSIATLAPAGSQDYSLIYHDVWIVGCPWVDPSRMLVIPPGSTSGTSVRSLVLVCTDEPLSNLEFYEPAIGVRLPRVTP